MLERQDKMLIATFGSAIALGIAFIAALSWENNEYYRNNDPSGIYAQGLTAITRLNIEGEVPGRRFRVSPTDKDDRATTNERIAQGMNALLIGGCEPRYVEADPNDGTSIIIDMKGRCAPKER